MRSADHLLARLRRSEVRTALRIGSWITLLVAVQAFLLYAFVAREYHEEAEQDLALHTEWVSDRMSARSDPGTFAQTMADLGTRAGLGVRRVDHDGGVRATAGRWPAAGARRYAATGLWSGLRLSTRTTQYLLRRVELPDGGHLEVALSLDRYATELREVRNGLAGILALSLVGALVVGWAATRRSFAPLRAATQALDALDAGALQTRLPDRGTGDFLDQHAAVLNAALERIATAIARLRSFSADVAHELRTPINRIAAVADASLLVDDPARSREAVHQIVESARGLTSMIDALLLLAQLEEGRRPLTNGPIAVRPWLEGLLSLYRPACTERGIAISDRIDAGVVSAERSLLDRAVCNLLDNAVSHGARGGRVDLTASESANGVEIAVSDAGPGISESDRHRVFDRFVRLDSARSSPGTGIGLSVAFAIARAHGGTLRVDTSRLGGARFVLSIPHRDLD
ncbi:HAMP domain-containing histidine kinase [Myxococcota bacterium]|nr:HAMP domain-containing histidine kinase [Myxococcota bacterium]